MRADFSFVQLDDAIERGGFDIPLLDQNRLDRTHPQLHLRKMGGLIIIVIVCSHRRDTTNYRLSGQISERSTLKTFGTTGTAGTIGTGLSEVWSKRSRASIRGSNGKFFPTTPDDSTGFEDSKVVSGSHEANYLGQDLTLHPPPLSNHMGHELAHV